MSYLQLPFGIRISSPEPIDADRYIHTNNVSRNTLITNKRAYVGMPVFVLDTKTMYLCTDLAGTGSWRDISLSLSGSVDYYDIANRPPLVSGSIQIDVTQTTNYSSIDQYTDSDNLSYMNVLDVVSGSNVTFDTVSIERSTYSYSENLSVDQAVPEVVVSLPVSTFTAVFFDYVVKKDENIRAGTILSIYSGLSTVYTDNSTTSFGDTSDVQFITDIVAGNLRLIVIVPDDGWEIKTLVRIL